jgi:hypothetical protein
VKIPPHSNEWHFCFMYALEKHNNLIMKHMTLRVN